ncbi:unnamed protein product [Darwinula stevensoni]|uniref:Protein twisted gastrulation n=1 Tax=Darwinula stevensoni TaxID=69355 RepID=A0A7R8X6M0_9CRUS|nr:unnamed protein product [Darwinula stevensoni]CAG0879597.1 unnamed protein product [Darwinula stevensoni]
MYKLILAVFSVSVGLLWTLTSSWACNEAVCASIVSKCMLTQSCKCNLQNCSCCKDCFQCLANLFDECCSCVASGGTEESQPKLSSSKRMTVNCTVSYIAQCVSYKKCRMTCNSMGAQSYRWFHDGCCECVGPYCLNYGINESRCSSCPEYEEQEYEDEDLYVNNDFSDGVIPEKSFKPKLKKERS